MPRQISGNECVVIDEGDYYRVDLASRICSCGIFQIIGVPCSPVVGFARIKEINVYSFCHAVYFVDTWHKSHS